MFSLVEKVIYCNKICSTFGMRFCQNLPQMMRTETKFRNSCFVELVKDGFDGNFLCLQSYQFRQMLNNWILNVLCEIFAMKILSKMRIKLFSLSMGIHGIDPVLVYLHSIIILTCNKFPPILEVLDCSYKSSFSKLSSGCRECLKSYGVKDTELSPDC